MAIAIFSDIHGNLEALEAILKNIKKDRRIKEIYFLGDAITFGPDSSACLKLLEKSGARCIVGNHEQRVVRYDRAVKTMTYASYEHMRHIFNSLDRDDIRFIKNMENSIKINYKGINIFFTHYAHDKSGVVRDDYEELTEARLHKLFDYAKSDVVFFGHIHKRKIIIEDDGKSFVCVGSSGCVKNDKTFYTYFEVQDDLTKNLDIYRVTVPFNRKKFGEKMQTADLPDKLKYAPYVFGFELKPQ